MCGINEAMRVSNQAPPEGPDFGIMSYFLSFIQCLQLRKSNGRHFSLYLEGMLSRGKSVTLFLGGYTTQKIQYEIEDEDQQGWALGTLCRNGQGPGVMPNLGKHYKEDAILSK